MSRLFADNIYVVLWRKLADGSAGVFVRLLLSVALGLLFTGLALCGSYLAALVFPGTFGRTGYGSSGSITAYPEEWTLSLAFASGGLAWLACLYWMWTRRIKWRMIWRAALGTVAIWVIAGFAMGGVAEWFRGDEEYLIGGIVCLAGTFTLLAWAPVVGRLIVYGRPAFQEDGRTLDVKCPKCGYSLVGLYEAKCPECGERFTLDRLLEAQGFARPGREEEAEQDRQTLDSVPPAGAPGSVARAVS